MDLVDRVVRDMSDNDKDLNNTISQSNATIFIAPSKWGGNLLKVLLVSSSGYKLAFNCFDVSLQLS